MAASGGTGGSPTSLWSIINQLQLLILFTLFETEIHDDIRAYIEGQDFAMFNFNFLGLDEIPWFDIPTEWTDAEQPIEGLENIDLDSRSTIKN